MGLPIMAPDLDFAHYVCGQAAVYYNPWNEDSAYQQLLHIHENSSLRSEIIRNGKEQLENRDKFSENWNQVAREILDCLQSIVAYD